MKVKALLTERHKSPKSSGRSWHNSSKKPRGNRMSMCTLLKASWRYQGKVFFAESTLHGVRYIAETARPLIERLIWFICVLIGAIATIVIIVSLWEKFQTNPTITGLDTDFHNWDIPFPAVTLCPNQPWNDERVDEYVQRKAAEHKLNETSVDQLTTYLKRLTQMSLLSLDSNNTIFHSDVGATLAGQDLHSVAYALMDNCTEMFSTCKWLAADQDCCTLFFPVFTENGFCYTFNSQHHEAYYPDGKKIPDKSTKYIKETNVKWSLQFSMEQRANQTYNISIFLHKDNELAGLNLKPQHVWDFTMLSMTFSMRETYTTEDATQLTIKQRHCIYDNEVKLTIDNIYTFAACTHQCRMNNAQRLCQCIPHFYKQTERYKLCNLTQLKCIAEKRAAIVSVDSCSCELGCSNTIYEVDKLIDKTSFAGDVTGKTDEGTSEDGIEVFECEFTSWPMIKYKREVLFGWVDLLVSFGGIAGLFLGFSLLSGVEIIYYFTIRACCMVYKQRDELEAIVANPPPKKQQDYDLGLVPYFIREAKDEHGRDEIRRRMKDKDQLAKENNKTMEKAQIKPLTPTPRPILVKPINPNKIIMPPFGFDYYN